MLPYKEGVYWESSVDIYVDLSAGKNPITCQYGSADPAEMISIDRPAGRRDNEKKYDIQPAGPCKCRCLLCFRLRLVVRCGKGNLIPSTWPPPHAVFIICNITYCANRPTRRLECRVIRAGGISRKLSWITFSISVFHINAGNPGSVIFSVVTLHSPELYTVH